MPDHISHEINKIKDAVVFTESKIQNPEISPNYVSAKALADQSAGMMLQDMRTFLQTNEQVITIGIGKAIALSLDSKNTTAQKGGIEALAAIERLMMRLPQFAQSVEQTANSILTQFGNPNAEYLNKMENSSEFNK